MTILASTVTTCSSFKVHTAFNPQLTQSEDDAAIADDPDGARAEWEVSFRSDLAAFLDDSAVAAPAASAAAKRTNR